MKGSSRRVGRKASRKNRKGRKNSRRVMRGGWVVMNPADLTDTSMDNSAKQSLAQGGEYNKLHAGQHGGGAILEGAPVGTTGVLDSSLREAAYLNPLDKSLAAIQGMSDQSGGRRKGSRKGRKASRKGASRKGRKGSRKGRKGASRKGRKASRKGRKGSRKMRGGFSLNPADFSAAGTLLPAELQSKALATMNPEWKLAENPAAFAPKA